MSRDLVGVVRSIAGLALLLALAPDAVLVACDVFEDRGPAIYEQPTTMFDDTENRNRVQMKRIDGGRPDAAPR